jgi:hypothetical protein
MTDDESALAALAEHGSYRKASAALGIPSSTFQTRVQAARRRSMTKLHEGAHPAPGYIVTRDSVALDAAGNVTKRYVQSKPDDGDVFEIPDGHTVKGLSALVGPDGRVLAQWIKTREDTASALVDALQEAFASHAGKSAYVPPPADSDEDQLTVYPIADLHFGMYAWGKETGASYDIKITKQTAVHSIHELVASSPASHRAVLLGLGDYFHANDEKAVTPKSGHRLDVDGRWSKVFLAGCELALDMVDIVLAKHQVVDINFLPGNHDPDSAVAIAIALHLFYRNNPRVNVNISPAMVWFLRFGKVFLGATHGHTMPPARMGAMMAATRAADWGQTLYRHFFFGHIHHKTGQEVPGVMVESFPSPAAPDAFNAGSGHVATRAMHAITFHREKGEKFRHRVNIAGAP